VERTGLNYKMFHVEHSDSDAQLSPYLPLTNYLRGNFNKNTDYLNFLDHYYYSDSL